MPLGRPALSTDCEALDSYGGGNGFEAVGGLPLYLDAARRAGEDSGRRLRAPGVKRQ